MPHPSRLSFAVANSLAALTALWIAFALDLQRPYWSTFAVFVVAKPLSGAVRSKAVFRLMGTLLGAGVALLLVPPLVQAPLLLCLAIACWIGFCVYVSSLDRTPRSYALVLAGYTAAIVGFSAVNTPLSIFDIAVARVEENSIGIVCAALAHSIFFPHNATEEVSGVLRAATDRAAGWIGTALRGMDPAVEEMAAPRAALVLDQLHAATTFIVYETSNVRRSGLLLATLQDRLALVPTHISAIHQAARAHAALSPLPPRITAALDQAAATVIRLRQAGSREQLPATIPRMATMADAPGPSTRIIEYEQSILWHLDELLATCRDFCLLTLALKERALLSAGELARPMASAPAYRLHVDRALALLSGTAAAGAVLLVCLIWIATAWPEGAVAAQFAAIGCSLFATLDQPAKILRSAILAILVALPVGAAYEFALLPASDGFTSLALLMLPLLLLFSYLQSVPRTEGAGLVLAIAFSGSLALQPSFQSDFAAFLNSNAAEVCGLIVAALVNVIFRTIDPAWNAWRISRAGWHSLRELARRRLPVDISAWMVPMFDRLGLVAQRLGNAAPRTAHAHGIDALRDLRTGLNVGRLLNLRPAADARAQAALDEVLELVAASFSARLRQNAGPDDARIDATIQRALEAAASAWVGESRLAAASALTGLRLDLSRPLDQPA